MLKIDMENIEYFFENIQFYREKLKKVPLIKLQT